MNIKNSINLVDYLSLILVLSFLLLHNIYAVFLGLLLALYSIKRSNIHDFINFIINKIRPKKIEKKDKIEEIVVVNNDKKIENNSLSLVEEIEELGFIPSINKKINSDAA